MKRITRKNEPDFWIKYKRSHPRELYSDLDKTVTGTEIRRYLRQYLLNSQNGLCAYCCRRIEMDNSLNEHIKPQLYYPDQSMIYENIIVSCKSVGTDVTCGNRKGHEYDEKLFVSPLEPDCEEKFIFYPNGQVEGSNEQGKYTCQILNLNAYELQRARRAQYKVCADYHDSDMIHTYFLTPSEDGMLESFADMIQYFYNRGGFV